MSDENHTDAPTVVLVHGAFADASSWNGVIERLQAKGCTVTAPAEPAARHRDRLRLHRLGASRRSPGPVLAVGHSYGGAVITNAATDAKNVVGLVYVAAFAPDEGEVLGAGRSGLEGQRPEHRAGPAAVPDRGRRIGDRVRDRSGQGPRRLRRRPPRPSRPR